MSSDNMITINKTRLIFLLRTAFLHGKNDMYASVFIEWMTNLKELRREAGKNE